MATTQFPTEHMVDGLSVGIFTVHSSTPDAHAVALHSLLFLQRITHIFNDMQMEKCKYWQRPQFSK